MKWFLLVLSNTLLLIGGYLADSAYAGRTTGFTAAAFVAISIIWGSLALNKLGYK